MTEPAKTISTSSLLQENRTFPPSPEVVQRAHLNAEQYQAMYDRSIQDPQGFWLEQARTLDWVKPPTSTLQYTWNTAERHIRHTWFEHGQLNVAANCLDRHLATRPDKPAIIWQGEPENETRTLTYAQLHREVCQFANVLKSLGIQKGDRVSIYLPMIPELPVVMLACTRIGAIHSIVFGGFSADSLSGRINDSTCKLLVTCQCRRARRQTILLKDHRRRGLKNTPSIENVVVFKRNETPCK
jgi:acetyl-CoA synthetase